MAVTWIVRNRTSVWSLNVPACLRLLLFEQPKIMQLQVTTIRCIVTAVCDYSGDVLPHLLFIYLLLKTKQTSPFK